MGKTPDRQKKKSRVNHVGFVMDKVELGQVFFRVLRLYPVKFIPPVLRYKEKLKKKINTFIFITGLHNKP